MWNGVGTSYVESSVATPLSNWYHFAISHDGTTLRAYVNGVAAGSLAFARANPIEDGTGLFYAIAAADTTNMGDGTYSNMRLGQFLVYDSALTAAQIEQSYRAGRRTYGV